MTTPNIDMIAASLRSCSLRSRVGGGQDQPSPPPLHHLAEESHESAGGVTVELNSEAAALPHHWEQCLDIRSGEIYYINWENGVRTTKDPRTAAAAYSSSYCYYFSDDDDDDAASSDEYSCASHTDSIDVDYEDDDNDDSESADSSSSLSSASPPSGVGGQVLVAAGCKSCFMYFMVPKSVDACPKCGGSLLHLGRNGCV